MNLLFEWIEKKIIVSTNVSVQLFYILLIVCCQILFYFLLDFISIIAKEIQFEKEYHILNQLFLIQNLIRLIIKIYSSQIIFTTPIRF